MNATTDWYETTRIAPNAIRITAGTGYLPCHVYLVGDGEQWLLIDAGLGIGDLRAMVTSLVETTPPVLLTHGHWDHVGAAHQFDTVSAHRDAHVDGTLASDPETRGGVDLSERFVDDWRDGGHDLPTEFDPDAYEIRPIDGVRSLDPGDAIDVGRTRLELVPIPGHSPSQLAALDRDAGICYGADILSPDGSVFAQFDDSDLEAYGESIERIIDLRDAGAFDVLATGHGRILRGDELDVLDDVHASITTVLESEPEPVEETDLWGPVRRSTVGGIEVLHT